MKKSLCIFVAYSLFKSLKTIIIKIHHYILKLYSTNASYVFSFYFQAALQRYFKYF